MTLRVRLQLTVLEPGIPRQSCWVRTSGSRPSDRSSPINRSRTASSAAVSTGWGRWSPRIRANRPTARSTLNSALGEGAGGIISRPLSAKAARSSARIAQIRAVPPMLPPCLATLTLRASLLGASHAYSGSRIVGYRVAVVGATGNVGRELLNVLVERQFPYDEIVAVASARSTGNEIDLGDSGKTLKVKNLDHFDFAGFDIALF